MIDPKDYVINNTLRILVKPGKKKNSIVGFDSDRKAVVVEIKAQAQDNKANLEVVRFFSRLLGKSVKIKTGLKSKEKVLIIN